MKTQPLITSEDVLEVAILTFESFIAWTVPERLWPRICQALAQLSSHLRRSRTQERRCSIAHACGAGGLSVSPRFLDVAIRAAHLESRLQLLREYRPDGWRPQLRLLGKQHVEAALAVGRGAILWLCPFTYSHLVVNKTLHKEGLRITRVGGPYHGFASIPPSRFAVQALNPLRTKVEDRYLAERICIPPNGSLGYVRVIRRRLEENHLICITANGEGHWAPVVPFLTGGIRLATGAASLALSTGAALLPVFLSRRGAGDFDTTIEAPMEVSGGVSHHVAAERLTSQYAALLERYVARNPHLWPGWDEFLERTTSTSDIGRKQ